MKKELHLHPLFWALIATLVSVLLSTTRQWQLIERKGYDVFTVQTAPDASELPIVIVGIDEPSFAELGLQWPWPRGLHAQLVEKLNRGGAAAIVFDIIFADPSDPEQDRAFAESIKNAGNVLLAGDISYLQTAQYEQLMRVDPLDQFLEAGAATGIARIDIDTDLVVRNLPESPQAIWREIVRLWQLKNPDDSLANPDLPIAGMVRYLSPVSGLRYVSYYQALDADSMLPSDAFQDKIVLIGLYLSASPDPNNPGTDMFATPFLQAVGSMTPGVEIHANFVSNGLQNRFVRALPLWMTWIVTAGVILLVSLVTGSWRPVRALLVVLVLAAALLAAGYWLFAHQDVWLAVGSSVLALALLYVMQGAAAFLAEIQKRKAIRRSFEHYVAPTIVKQLIEEPERLRLSGEYFDTTVVFTDLVGFTSITEKMEPMELRRLLTQYFTRMVDEMLANKGTLDKFIGDAMMCFFGVPIETGDHPLQAVRTAWGMKLALQELNREWSELGLPEFGMRIGVHSGRVVAGNMGTENLFNYTIMGDCVNTGARLEGANRFYGTDILVGETTFPHVKAEYELRRLDIVRVKGKEQAIAVYELLGPKGEVAEDRLKGRAVYEKALELYVAGRFEEAEGLFRDNAVTFADPASRVLADRCGELRNNPPENWRGIHSWMSK